MVKAMDLVSLATYLLVVTRISSDFLPVILIGGSQEQMQLRQINLLWNAPVLLCIPLCRIPKGQLFQLARRTWNTM